MADLSLIPFFNGMLFLLTNASIPATRLGTLETRADFACLSMEFTEIVDGFFRTLHHYFKFRIHSINDYVLERRCQTANGEPGVSSLIDEIFMAYCLGESKDIHQIFDDLRK